MKTPLFQEKWQFIEELAKKHPKAGFFLVGGAVRDALLGRKIKDFDFVFTGIELENLIEDLKPHGEVNLVGKRFGVIKFRPSETKTTVDIALPRKEFSLSFSGGYRDFSIQSDPHMPVEEDLARRDLTINAMAYNVVTHELVDPFLGERDIKKKILRTVGSPTLRFQEDYSRMLRAIRFACQLDFSVTEKTSNAIQEMAHHINNKIDNNWVVAREVIAQEFLKAFDADTKRSLELFDEYGFLALLLPELKAQQETKQSPPWHMEGPVWNHTVLALEKLESEEFKRYFSTPPSILTKLAVLFHDIGKPLVKTEDTKGIHFPQHEDKGAELTRKICSRLALSSSSHYPFACKDLAWIVKHHLYSIYHQKRPLTKVKLEELFYAKNKPSLSLLQTMLADQLASVSNGSVEPTAAFKQLYADLQKMAPDKELPEPLLTGKEIMDLLNIPEGPKIKEHLQHLREKQLSGELLTKPQAKEYLKSSLN